MPISVELKICDKCSTPQPLDCYALLANKVRAGRDVRYRSNICKLCRREHNRAYWKKNRVKFNKRAQNYRNSKKLKAIAYKGGACAHCGNVYHQAAFDFHHVDSTQKDLDPGLMMGRSWEALKAEIDKCILLCSNCHRVHHFENGY